MAERITGEYWITNTWEVIPADDSQHEAIILEHARKELLELLGLSVPDDCDWIIFNATIQSFLKEHQLSDKKEELAIGEILRENEQDENLRNEQAQLLKAAYDRTDLRNFAMNQWGWIWVRHNEIAAAYKPNFPIGRLREKLLDILYDEGLEAAEAGEIRVALRFLGSNKSIHTEISSLSQRNLETEFPSHLGPNDQVRRMDQQLLHPCYRKSYAS